MEVMDYFKPVPAWTAQAVREFIGEKDDGTYNLIDVRQPGEYEKGHLPGARLIPVGQMDERLEELDPGKITIVYCATGLRSRAVASILARAGFPEVYSMTGGINAWSGLVAGGFPEAGIPWFSVARSPGELTALAWALEDGTRTFYEKMAGTVVDPDAALLFRDMAKSEESHQEMLAGLYRDVSGTVGAGELPCHPGGYPRVKTMEGGMRVDDAVAWADGKVAKEILELAISLETGSYDRYQTHQRWTNDENYLEIFRSLATEEKRHLGLMIALFEKLQ